MNGGDFTPFLIRHGDNIGDVVFTLRVVVGQLRQPAFQSAPGDQNTGVNFLNLTLRIAGIFMLNNAGYLPFSRVMRPYPLGSSSFTVNRPMPPCGFAARRRVAFQRKSAEHRRTASDVFIIRKERRRLLHGMPVPAVQPVRPS
jgi:hypothetical protein